MDSQSRHPSLPSVQDHFATSHEVPPSSLLLDNALTSYKEEEIDGKVADASSDRQILDTRTKQLQLLSDGHEVTRTLCHGFLETHKCLLSPAHPLPPEIWSEIFLWHHRCHGNVMEPFFTATRPPQFRAYGSVCHMWRNVMFQTPELWSSITIRALRLPAHALQVLDIWLQRSKQCPLLIDIDGFGLNDGNFTFFFDCVKLLSDHGYRWKTFLLEMPDWSDRLDSINWLEFWPHSLDFAPVLESCSLYIRSCRTKIITNAPGLKLVQLCIDDDAGLLPPLLPWSSVTKLEMGKFLERTLEIQANYLRSFPCLEELTLTRIDNFSEIGSPPPFSHPVLKRLTIDGGSGLLISALEASSLEFLDLHCDFLPLYRQNSADFIRRCHNLRSFRLRKEWGIIQHLVNVKQIEKLSLFEDFSYDPRSIKGITEALTILLDPAVLPEVKTLEIRVCFDKFRSSASEHKQHLFILRDTILSVCRNRLQSLCRNNSRILEINLELLLSIDSPTVPDATDILHGLGNIGVDGLHVDVHSYYFKEDCSGFVIS